MSSESQIKFKGREIWFKDGFLLVFYVFLFDELKFENEDLSKLQNELVENINYMLEDTFGFLDFNEFIKSEKMKLIMITHIETIISKIENVNNYFSLENLDIILLDIKNYHLKILDYEPSKEIISKHYSDSFINVKDNYVKEFREIKSLLEAGVFYLFENY